MPVLYGTPIDTRGGNSPRNCKRYGTVLLRSLAIVDSLERPSAKPCRTGTGTSSAAEVLAEMRPRFLLPDKVDVSLGYWYP